MLRGKHVRRNALLVWLFTTGLDPAAQRAPSWRAVHAHSLVLLHDEVRTLEAELAQLRAVPTTSTSPAATTELRVQQLERQLAAAQADVAALQAELAAVREDLVWAFAERRPGPQVVAAAG